MQLWLLCSVHLLRVTKASHALLLQVTAHLDPNNILTIEAQDLDSGRHHLWKHGGGSVVADGIQANQLNTNGHYVVDYTQSLQQPIRA